MRNENFQYSHPEQEDVPFQLKESSKVKFNLFSNVWTAEDGSVTYLPFGIHQIQAEIITPIIQNLINETREERLKIYNHIQGQKNNYLYQWNQDTQDFFVKNYAGSASLIQAMKTSIRDYIAAFHTLISLKKTEENMVNTTYSSYSDAGVTPENSEEITVAFEAQLKEFQDIQIDFENYIEELKNDFSRQIEAFENTACYEAQLRDGKYKDLAIAAQEIHSLNNRRKSLVAISPLFAKTAEIPPELHIDQTTYEYYALNLPFIAKESLEEMGDFSDSASNESDDIEPDEDEIEEDWDEDFEDEDDNDENDENEDDEEYEEVEMEDIL
jgi:hypothetical protein